MRLSRRSSNWSKRRWASWRDRRRSYFPPITVFLDDRLYLGERTITGCSSRFQIGTLGAAMNCPFPGKDPYLEHPVLWEGVHARLMVAIANQLQPKLDPRHVASIEERVFIEGPQRRVPDRLRGL
jgi:Protein of unknown function (DUF4058)